MGKNRLPVFKKFCFCIPLRIGVAIVGYWSIALLLVSMVMTVALMASTPAESGYNHLARAYIFRTLNLIVQIVYLVLAVMLLIGAHKKKPEYLRHFFTSGLVMILVHTVALCFSIVYQVNWTLVLGLFLLASNIYGLLIVRSSYLAMEEKERGPRCEPDEEVCWDTMQLAHVVT